MLPGSVSELVNSAQHPSLPASTPQVLYSNQFETLALIEARESELIHDVDDFAGISLKYAVQVGSRISIAPNPLDDKKAVVISLDVIQTPLFFLHKADLHTSQSLAKSYEISTQSVLASSHCWLMPSCSRSAYLDVHSSLSPVETPNSGVGGVGYGRCTVLLSLGIPVCWLAVSDS
ncbi:hypothetical protein Nepgr_007814 [Nepenthes gracilis]|uniref:Uncharacterized protein n=1 Tax=Nepenthes gracilis TaxID=150966 RepID=A0AAD3S7T4_NEPGR|nr:hypothetical protein Nepgr_007814 [Nepenthes gracilis]